MVSVLDGSRVLLKILRNPEAVFFIPNSSVDQGLGSDRVGHINAKVETNERMRIKLPCASSS